MAAPTTSGVTCSRCGAVSPLGRVFCGGCGGRLELASVSSGSFVQARRLDVPWLLIGQIVGGVLLIVAAVASLAFVTQTSLIGVEGSGAGAGTIAALKRAAANLPRGQIVGRRVAEKDINGFFRGDVLRRMNVDAFSVDLDEGTIRVRMVETLGKIEIGTWQIRPRLSTDLALAPDGNRLRFGRVRQGLLPLVGPLKHMAIRRVYRRLAVLDEWGVCKYIADVQAHGDALDVTLQR